MTRRVEATKRLADLIDDEFLRSGAGLLDVRIDDIVEKYREVAGKTTTSTAIAGSIVERRLAAALVCLWEDHGWHYVPVTEFFFRTFANGVPRHLGDATTTEDEIKRSIAGLGRAQARAGLHFIVGTDDWLFAWHNAHGTRNGIGKVKRNAERAIDLKDAGELTPDGIIAIGARIGSEIGDANRLVRRLTGKKTA